MAKDLDSKSLKHFLKDKNLYLIFGNDILDQYQSITELSNYIKLIIKDLSENSVIIYFGENYSKDNLCIGYVFNEIKNKVKNIDIIYVKEDSIQNDDIPPFVTYTYTTIIKNNKQQRGVLNKNNKIKPLGLTKVWYDMNKIKKINTIYIISGNDITIQEYDLAKSLDITIKYCAIKRKYIGDGKTLVKKNASDEVKIGLTYYLNNLLDDEE